MTTQSQTEALKLVDALNELLESFEKDGKFCKSSSIRNELYDCLKQTLEESKEALAQPEQETVAEVVSDAVGYLSIKLRDKWTPNEGDKLYTTPPQRKQLTFSKLCDIEYEITHRDGDFSILKFARAIEAAHGIKGEA